MGLRTGLLASLTLVLACALLWDRLHPPRTAALFPRDLPASEDTARVIVGGNPAPAPPPAPAAPAAAPAAPPAGKAKPAPAGAPPAAMPRTHRVAGGDTLYAIARRYYGDGSRWSRIAEANGLSEGDALRVGRTLRIP